MDAIAWVLILVVGALFGVSLLVQRARGGGDVGWGLLAAAESARERFREEVEGFEVRLEAFEKGAGEDRRTCSRLVLGGRGRIPPELALRHESGWQGLRNALGKEDVQLEDGEFDAAVNVQGPEDVTLAALRSEARVLVAAFVAAGGEVRAGDLHFPFEGAVPDRSEVRDVQDLMVRVAKALAVDSVPAALLRNVTGDPNPRLRLRSLAALATGHAGAPQTQPALRASLADVDPHVRLLAAQHLEAGPEVQATLEKLVEGVEVPGEVRASALERLAQRLPYASIAPVVRRAIQQGVEPLCRVAVEAAGRGKDETQLGPLTKIGTTAGAALGKAVARALGRIGGAGAEEGLLALLANGEESVQREAALELGRIGTVRCVEPLLAKAQGVFGDAALEEAAREAVRAIQGRLGDADGGRLSVVDERAGEGGLSVGSIRERERG